MSDWLERVVELLPQLTRKRSSGSSFTSPQAAAACDSKAKTPH